MSIEKVFGSDDFHRDMQMIDEIFDRVYRVVPGNLCLVDRVVSVKVVDSKLKFRFSRVNETVHSSKVERRAHNPVV